MLSDGGDRYRISLLCPPALNRAPWLWVPAFAGTTGECSAATHAAVEEWILPWRNER